MWTQKREHSRRHPERSVRVLGFDSPCQGGLDVGLVALESDPGRPLIMGLPGGIRPLHQTEKVLEVPSPHLLDGGGREVRETLDGVVTDEFVQVVAAAACAIGHSVDQGVVGQHGQGRQGRPSYGFGGCTVEPAAEDTEAAEDPAILRGKPLPRAIEDRVDTAMPLLDRSHGRAEHRGPLVEHRHDVKRRQDTDPAGHKLDGERQAPDTRADIANGIGVGFGERIRRAGHGSPVDEQLDSVPGPLHPDTERRQVEHHLDVAPQRTATGGQHRHVRADRQQGVDKAGAGGDQMLAVVEHDQQVSVGERSLQRDVDLAAWHLRQVERRRDRPGDVVGFGDSDQRHPNHAEPEPVRR